MFDRGHYARDELQEEEEAVLDARLAPVLLDLVDHALHNCGVVARVNAQLAAWKLCVLLIGDRLLGIIGHNVLEHILLREQLPALGVALQPEARRSMVIVVRN